MPILVIKLNDMAIAVLVLSTVILLVLVEVPLTVGLPPVVCRNFAGVLLASRLIITVCGVARTSGEFD